MRRIHFIGICGTAMATLAALLKARGHKVQGSDAHVYPPMSDFLAREGIIVFDGYSRRAPRSRHRPGRRRQRHLARATRNSRRCSTARGATPRCPRRSATSSCGTPRSVVVAGTHGKTTTTAIAGLAADQRRARSVDAGRRHRPELRRRRRQLPAGRRARLRHRRRRVRQRLLRQDRQVPRSTCPTSPSSTTSSSITPTSTPISTRCGWRSRGWCGWCRGAGCCCSAPTVRMPPSWPATPSAASRPSAWTRAPTGGPATCGRPTA